MYRLGDASKLFVGFPAFGYRYPGATGPSQRYDSSGDEEELIVSLKDIPLKGVSDRGEIIINGAWTTILTPNMIRASLAQIHRNHRKLGGTFVWELTGATPDFMQALHGRQQAA